MLSPSRSSESDPIERHAVEVFSELNQDIIVRRSREVSVLLRMSMLAGLEMELASTLNLLCDLAAEIVSYTRAAVYFWEEESALMRARVTRNMPNPDEATFARASVLNYWAAKLARPLLLNRQSQIEAAALLQAVDAASVLVVPLFVRNRVMGSMQLFGERNDSFSREDAQLLWMLSLIAESMLARDYSNQTLLRFAFTDFLTGLKTRALFEQQLVLEIARAERRNSSLAALMIDIDHFKRLNDTHGHPGGDLVLRDVAAILAHDLREIDTAARYGGEEFILLLPETDLQGAKLVAQRLRSSVEQANFFTGSSLVTGHRAEHVTISIGIALFPHDARSKSELIEASDAALYQAKRNGRNCVVPFAELTNQKAS
jgi:diguanylate cyclase (GGDEF)-like protein